MHDDYDPLDYSKLIPIQLALLAQLPPDLRAIADRAEPGSVRLHPLGGREFGITIGISEPVVLGQFHADALRRDNEPGSVN